MLIQRYYYETSQENYPQSNSPQLKQKVLEKLHLKQEKDLGHPGWKRLFTSTQFGDSTTDLCNTFAEVIKKLCTAENLSSSLEAFLACRLIAFKKNLRLRPIGVPSRHTTSFQRLYDVSDVV